MAAGTVTITETRLYNVHKVKFAWVAGTDADAGTATGTTTYDYSGNILKVVTVPSVSAQPSDNYDITLTDEDSIDVANSQLLNRDETNAEWVVSSLGAIVADKLTINVADAGASAEGTCIVYIGLAASDAVDVDVENALYGTTGVVTFPAAAAAADGVSIAEVLRYIQESQIGTLANTGGTATLGGILGDVANSSIATRLNNVGSLVATKDITYTGEVSYAAFTVTGLVAVKVVGYVTTALSNHADSTSVGTATSAAGLIAATAGTAMQTTGQAWVDNAPSKFETFPANWTLIGNGEDIAVVGTANITEGVVSLYCWYIPISTGAAVAAA